MSRLKSYYTVNEVELNLYTDGGEFQLEDRSEYIGEYHRYISTNEIYTKASFIKNESEPLFILNQFPPESLKYRKLKPKIKTFYQQPEPVQRTVTQKDIDAKQMTRFFLKQINTSNIIEIDSAQKEAYSQKKIDTNLYNIQIITWTITGPVQDNTINGIFEEGVLTKNKKEISRVKKLFPGIEKKLSDLTQFYVDTDFIVPEDIN